MKSSQIARNQSSANAWSSYAGHRNRVMQILKQQTVSKVTLLGAGNCNDVDLRKLLDVVSVARLVDIDEEALSRGKEQQGVGAEPQLDSVGRDLSGIAPLLGASPLDLASCIAAAEDVEWQLEGDQDLVVSLCLWTQIVDAVADAFSSGSTAILPLLLTLRRTHLDRMIRLLRPGGQCWLITDIVSSDTVLELQAPNVDLAALMKSLLAEGNFFTAANPLAIRQDLLSAQFRTRIDDCQLVEPWLWNQGVRQFLCTAIGFRRSA